MPVLPILKPRQILLVLLKAGFYVHHQTGSHARLLHRVYRNRRVTIPMHNKDIPRPILKSILKQASLSVEEFLKLLRRGK